MPGVSQPPGYLLRFKAGMARFVSEGRNKMLA